MPTRQRTSAAVAVLFALLAALPPAPAGEPAARVTLEQARDIALARTGGGEVVKTETDHERGGYLVYEFDIFRAGVKYEVEVDAATGKVMEYSEKHPR